MDNKTLLNRVVKATGLDIEVCQDCQEALGELLENALAAGDTVTIPSFGNFEPRKRNERILTHPSSQGKRLLVPPKVVVSFKPSSILKNRINSNKEADEQ